MDLVWVRSGESPPAMHGTGWIARMRARFTFEHGRPIADLHKPKAGVLGSVRLKQSPGDDRLEHLFAGQGLHFLPAYDSVSMNRHLQHSLKIDLMI
jgi:hypothetical protein